MRVIVLYEDERGPTTTFPFHDFVLRCVSDQTGIPLPELKKHISGRPLRGNGNVLARIQRDLGRMENEAEHVLAVFDADRVCRLARLPEGTPEPQVLLALAGTPAHDSRLQVCLLKQNLETVLEALGECRPSVSRATLEQALQKNLNARDKLFGAVAWGHERAERDCILKKVPSLAVICDHLVRWMAERAQTSKDSAARKQEEDK